MTQYLKTFLLTSCLVAVAGCSDESKTPNTNPPECEDGDCGSEGSDEESTDEEGTTGRLDGGKGALDAGKPTPSKDGGASDASTAKDAGKATDARVGMDAAADEDEDAGTADAGKTDAGKTDAGKTDAGKTDAGEQTEEDAGASDPDAGRQTEADAGRRVDSGSAPTGTCGGDTPHGCFVAESDNIPGCPAIIPEVPALVSPFVDRPSCEGSNVAITEVCSYAGPTGRGSDTGLANCVCDASDRWLCIYP